MGAPVGLCSPVGQRPRGRKEVNLNMHEMGTCIRLFCLMCTGTQTFMSNPSMEREHPETLLIRQIWVNVSSSPGSFLRYGPTLYELIACQDGALLIMLHPSLDPGFFMGLACDHLLKLCAHSLDGQIMHFM